jgi:GNAT superfamily N-acetyltransferase
MTGTETVTCRYMLQRDLPSVCEIDEVCFYDFWDQDSFTAELRNLCTSGIVAASDKRIYGYALYNFSTPYFVILRIAVHPRFRRECMGSLLVKDIIYKLKRRSHKFQGATTYLPDCNLESHLFFSACGFQATSVERKFWQDQDYYRFEYSIEERKSK